MTQHFQYCWRVNLATVVVVRVHTAYRVRDDRVVERFDAVQLRRVEKGRCLFESEAVDVNAAQSQAMRLASVGTEHGYSRDNNRIQRVG